MSESVSEQGYSYQPAVQCAHCQTRLCFDEFYEEGDLNMFRRRSDDLLRVARLNGWIKRKGQVRVKKSLRDEGELQERMLYLCPQCAPSAVDLLGELADA